MQEVQELFLVFSNRLEKVKNDFCCDNKNRK
jgi:hypothetical protein